MPEPHLVLVVAPGLVLLGVIASKVSTVIGVPALILFLGLGMLAGSEGLGGIDFVDYHLAQLAGVVALSLILFSGGLATDWAEVRPVVRHGLALATVGVLVTTAVVGMVATVVLDVPLKTGLLLGAIVSSTDAAAVFSVLRSRATGLRGPIRPLLELESGINDPTSAFLTIGLLELIMEPDTSPLWLAATFARQVVVGALVGYLAARVAVRAINQAALEHDGLYPVATLALAVFVFGVADALGGSGFLAVYLAGLVMGNRDLLHKRSLVRFHDAVAWLAQIGMFLVLGLLVFPSELLAVAGPALVVAAALTFIARPVAVLLTMAPTRLTRAEQLMVAWVGLRGAVPIVLATFPLVRGAPHAQLIFDVVFFAVLVSVLLQGTTLFSVARRLRVTA
jgi:cell volume regulation protein A